MLCFGVLCGARGFDSGAWLTKRAMFDREAERLQAAYTNCVANLRTPAENVTVPIEHYPDGAVKASVTARKAQFFLDEGLVWCEGVCVRECGPDGRTERGRVEAESCVIDRETRSGWADGRARATYGRTTVEGRGIYFSFEEEFVKITSEVEITSRDLKFEGVKL